MLDPQRIESLIGTSLRGYRITRFMARGGMGLVYEGVQESLGRRVAIKILYPHLSADPRFGERFEREARATAQLSHPNIVRVLDYGISGLLHFMVMEYVDGESLGDRLATLHERGERLPTDAMLEIVRKISSALAYAHRLGYVHRDVKPGNILLSRDGDVLLTDFGVVKVLAGQQVTSQGLIIGTPEYMAPEQSAGETDIRPPADQYALAIVTYEMLVGRVPFQAPTPLAVMRMHLSEPPPAPSSFVPSFSRQLDAVLLRALSKDPDGRFASVTDFFARLFEAVRAPRPSEPSATGVMAERPTPAPPTNGSATPPPSTVIARPTPERSRRFVFGGGLIALLLIAALGYVLATGGYFGNGGQSAQDNGATSVANTSALAGSGAPASSVHPRLWLRADDLPRLRVWAVPDNPLYRDGIEKLAQEAKARMDAGDVPGKDNGDREGSEVATEMYAQLFAFMSLIEPKPETRDDYARRAHSLLMHVMNEAAKGAAENQPFRDPAFATSGRARWTGEGFALTVDWIYPSLSARDKAVIREVFLRWAGEIVTTSYLHPEPVGLVNNQTLLQDRTAVRSAADSAFTASMRNLGLMALALEPGDDPRGELQGYLKNATGSWLYIVDDLLRYEAQGGLAPVSFEAHASTLGPVAQLLLALHTAGEDQPERWGAQVALQGNAFWDDAVTAWFHALSPAPAKHPWLGQVYQPATYGYASDVWVRDPIELYGPIGLYDRRVGNGSRLDAIRWLQIHTAPGGAERLAGERVGKAEIFRDAIFYFLLLDPGAPSPADPRPALPLTFYAPGVGRVFARTSWTADATWFVYSLGWISLDGQYGDGNSFAIYRQGEWVTRARSGAGPTIEGSEYQNTLALENNQPKDPDDAKRIIWQRGSQWLHGLAAGDGQILAVSAESGYLYLLGDATALYNSDYFEEDIQDITHASRSIIWIEPDLIVVYDRAESRTAGRFKRFWLQLPNQAATNGNVTTVPTPKGQLLFINTMLPTDAVVSTEPAEPLEEEAIAGDPMTFRLRAEAPGGPASARFLHTLQVSNVRSQPAPAARIQNTEGAPFEGVVIKQTAVLFPVDLAVPFDRLSYTVPSDTTTHLITGLLPGGGYNVTMQALGPDVRIELVPGTTHWADSGGVLRITGSGG